MIKIFNKVDWVFLQKHIPAYLCICYTYTYKLVFTIYVVGFFSRNEIKNIFDCILRYLCRSVIQPSDCAYNTCCQWNSKGPLCCTYFWVAKTANWSGPNSIQRSFECDAQVSQAYLQYAIDSLVFYKDAEIHFEIHFVLLHKLTSLRYENQKVDNASMSMVFVGCSWLRRVCTPSCWLSKWWRLYCWLVKIAYSRTEQKSKVLHIRSDHDIVVSSILIEHSWISLIHKVIHDNLHVIYWQDLCLWI